MKTSRPKPASTTPDDRIESIDALRGMALFGVLIVNLVTEFRISIFQQFVEPGANGNGLNRFVERIVSLGFESKAICLFAVLFGVGLAIQFDRLSLLGRPRYWLGRRLGVLLAFGLVHLLFIWNGDILTHYAIAGLLVLPLLSLPSSGLLAAALGLLALHAAGALAHWTMWPSAEALQRHVALANQVYSTGDAAEIWRFSIQELPLILPFHVFVFPRTLALFLFGMWLWRAGILKRRREFRDRIIVTALVGISAGAALTWADDQEFLKAPLAALAPVMLALGYGAALMACAQQRWLLTFAPIGRMAFSNYLMQSIIFGFVFFGYGLGLFGRMEATPAFVLGAAVYVAQLFLSRWWLSCYRFGPIEWLWRTLMYGSAQPMSKLA